MAGGDAYAQPFSELSYDDVNRVGGKSASLGELTNAGVRVPSGFAVTTKAFEAFLGTIDPGNDIRSTIAGLKGASDRDIERSGREIRDRINDAEIPHEIIAAIREAYHAQIGDREDLPLAVRSSATCEDSEDASFAGLQDTYLWTRGVEDLLRRIRSCWASLYNTESITYRQRLDLDESDIAMAVVVQEMVDAECAGVMFTRSPTTGDRSVIVIESSWGLGSSLVSGEVTPDRFVVNKVTGEINVREVATKQIEHVPHPAGSGVKEQKVEKSRRSEPSVTDEQIGELWRIGRRIEKHYGSPQDIEWAIPRAESDDDRSVCLLQSRPETVWAGREQAPAAKPKDKAFDHVLSMMTQKKS